MESKQNRGERDKHGPERKTGNSTTIANILAASSSGYALDIFTAEEIAALEILQKRGKPYLTCHITGKERLAKPEEISPPTLPAQTHSRIWLPQGPHRHREGRLLRFVDARKTGRYRRVRKGRPPTRPISSSNARSPSAKTASNNSSPTATPKARPSASGRTAAKSLYLHREEPNLFKNLPDIPRADQKLSDLLSERWDIKRLTDENRLVHERLSLRDIILDMEDLVLANAGVDAFDEVFKLIYAKLYDEWNASRGPARKRSTSNSASTVLPPASSTIASMACSIRPRSSGRASSSPTRRIELEPNHLITCVSFLEDIKLFNSNLQVIDEAFEYLAVQVGKGAKGQYFTPRHVIDMCVKMLNPRH